MRKQSMMDGYMTDENEDDSEDKSVVDNEKSHYEIGISMTHQSQGDGMF